MEKLYQEDQSKVEKDDDLTDVATLYAAALMNISPWRWWNKGEPTEEIANALQVLSKVLNYGSNDNEKLVLDGLHHKPEQDEDEVRECKLGGDQIPKPESKNIGANHYFSHVTEESLCPQLALPSANRIAELAPAAGHIQHMPSHVYERIGEYAKATEANYKAVYVDRAYIYQTPETARYPLHYLSHNLHFLADSLSIQGRESEAFAAAQELLKNTKKYSVDDYNPLYNQKLVQTRDDYFFTVPIWTAVRFNAWDFLSNIEHKEALFEIFTKRHLPFTETMWTYGQALKYLATTRDVTMEDALEKLEEFWEEVGQADPKLRYGNNDASKLFRIANLVLVARTLEALTPRVSNDFINEVKNRLENYSVLNQDSGSFDGHTRDERIINTWTKAVNLEDSLNYNEPPDWYYPVRESLGAAYYRQKNFGEAETVFCKNLQIHKCDYEKEEIHKMNGRALFGLIKSIKAQSDSTEVQPHKEVPEKLKSEFEKAWKNATVELSLKTM